MVAILKECELYLTHEKGGEQLIGQPTKGLEISNAITAEDRQNTVSSAPYLLLHLDEKDTTHVVQVALMKVLRTDPSQTTIGARNMRISNDADGSQSYKEYTVSTNDAEYFTSSVSLPKQGQIRHLRTPSSWSFHDGLRIPAGEEEFGMNNRFVTAIIEIGAMPEDIQKVMQKLQSTDYRSIKTIPMRIEIPVIIRGLPKEFFQKKGELIEPNVPSIDPLETTLSLQKILLRSLPQK